jgi:hypothetical protein
MWWTSIRSLVTFLVAITFCYLAAFKTLDPKDFMLVVVLVFNFYFLEKRRSEPPEDEKK